MEAYIARYRDKYSLSLPKGHRKEAIYGYSNPRFHFREPKNIKWLTTKAEKWLKDDFQTLDRVITDYVEHNGCVPYCVILQCLASRYLGAGMLDPEFLSKGYPYRSSPQFSLIFWNLGNCSRSDFNKWPLPEKLQKFETYVDKKIDRDHKAIGGKPQFNNYFINVIKNLGAPLTHELRGSKPLSSQALAWRGAIYHVLQRLSCPYGCCSCGKGRICSTNCWLQN